MLGLAQACVHPDTNTPYIKTSEGGKNNSIEGMEVRSILCLQTISKAKSNQKKGGLTHGFVVYFESVEDRDYYVKKDPAHLKFVESIGDIMAGARVIDFEPGVF
jgi:hypothetical protein